LTESKSGLGLLVLTELGPLSVLITRACELSLDLGCWPSVLDFRR